MILDFKKRFIVSSIATIPVLLLSKSVQNLLYFSVNFPKRGLVILCLTSFIYAYGGWPFLKGALREVKALRPGMMTLVALAITIAQGYSALVLVGMPGKMFFWEVATLIDIMLFGHWIEMKATMGAHKSLETLAKLLPSTVNLLLQDGSFKAIELSSLKPGDKVLIRPGEKIPADGVITEGHAHINQALLTGESKPIFKERGSKVIGGSINQNGSLVVLVNSVGTSTYLAKIIELVQAAHMSKSRAQSLANKAAFVLTVLAIVSGLGTLGYWLVTGQPFYFALERMVTVMVITCPHALGIAIPLVISSITTMATERGVFIKDRLAFEQARKAQIVLFDKTGTLTSGVFGITQIIPLASWNKEKLVQQTAAVEQRSEHSIAKSIVEKAKALKLTIPHVANFKAIPGVGVKGFVDGNELFVGSPEIILGHENFSTNFTVEHIAEIQRKIQVLTDQGKTVVVVATKNKIYGLFTFSDAVRQESIQACDALRKLKIDIAMITGDNEQVAQNAAEQLEITHVFANVLPVQKTEKIIELQKKYTVIMVGDGINDAPALAQADVGIAIGSGTDIAAETADVILVKDDPRDVVTTIKLSRLMRRKTLQNLAWATGYNIIAIPLAAGMFGVMLHPAIGAIAMSLSTIMVAINSKNLKI
jgi:P-type Cu2+ transporter